MLRICFVGLGSIGKRHIKNITYLLQKRGQIYSIDAVRSTNKGLPSDIAGLISHVYYNIDELQGKYDIVFITNPTIYHYDSIRRLGIHTKHMFIEKPVFHKYMGDIEELCLHADNIYYVACPLRYNCVLKNLKVFIKNEQTYSAHIISSSYLPEWRTGTDYREGYSAHRDMGGGVSLDLIHELDYAVWLFGMPERSIHLCGRYSELEIDSDDLSVYLLQYKDKIVEIHTDYFGRESTRKLELYCRDYVIKADLLHNTLEYVYPDGNIKCIALPQNDMYLQEMEAFLDILEGKRENDNDIIYANQVLKIALK